MRVLHITLSRIDTVVTMNFRQCLLIAIGIHVAIMGIPIKEKVGNTQQTIALIITEKPKSNPATVVKVTPIETPVRPGAEIKIPKSEQRKKQKSKPRKKKPEIFKKPVKNMIEPEKVIKEPERSPTEATEPIEAVSVVATPVRIVAAKDLKPTSGMVPVQFGSEEGPQFLRRIIPGYPLRAKRLHKQGIVILMLTIDAEGNLADVKIMKKAGFGFDEAAVKAVQESTFKAASQNGTSIACRALLPMKFQLR
jgi:protein TonB